MTKICKIFPILIAYAFVFNAYSAIADDMFEFAIFRLIVAIVIVLTVIAWPWPEDD